ncbi:MAG: type I DNA topoisomerase [Bacilli bacterium]|nr:type I DNA topoisomerase [Bacilli bacterium]
MADKLVIVESPTKSRTIEQYLGSDFKVKSSKGHIRDLAIAGPGGLGVDIKNNFKPDYRILAEKKDTVKELNNAVKKAKEIYLASDPDREGEAISWHLADTLDIGDRPVYRVMFNEITKQAVLEALENPGKINMQLVLSQETRRILDRIIGFKLSKLLQSKIKARSAGRVQSAVLKLIVDKEAEIDKFVIEEYYEIYAKFADFEAKLVKIDGKTAKISTLEKAESILHSLSNQFTVKSVETKLKSTSSKPPFTTSTLAQEASTKLGFTSSKTMSVAEKLYQGVSINNENVGLITYLRTDSTRLSHNFIHSAFECIAKHYGKDYLGHPKHPKSKNKLQDAHEAIRPTNCDLTPEKVKPYLQPDEYRLYRLIYARAIASLMKSAQSEQTTIELENENTLFRATGSKPIFDGYLAAYGKFDDETDKNLLPNLEQGKKLDVVSIEKKQLFTTPPSRYSEARLIKEMEDLGIGRPSTYATTIQILKMRHYVSIKDKRFVPTDQGKATIEKLDHYFHEFISSNYSKQMEDTLDEIAQGEKERLGVLTEFYDYFNPLVDNAYKEMKKTKPVEVGELCPECNSPLVIRHSRYGDFVACSRYPECKYIKPDPNRKPKKEVQDTGVTCPQCHEGTLVKRIAGKGKKKGKPFFGCSRFPKCKHISPYKPLDQTCPKCNAPLVEDKDGSVFCLDQEKCGYKQDK